MSEFNRMTLVAAVEIMGSLLSHADMEVIEVQWGIAGRCTSTSKSARIASWAKIACDEEHEVMTEHGLVSLPRALVEEVLKDPERAPSARAWGRFVAGLRFDGFDINETEVQAQANETMPWRREAPKKSWSLVRMLPDDIPGLDFREAENEITLILHRAGFAVADGHLKLALAAFQRGDWSPANGELRKFFESYLSEIAVGLGYTGGGDAKAHRDYLGGQLQPPFLLLEYNEWNSNNQKPQYVQGLMSRMHPHGGHPGLSEEEDASFRLQITLVSARLFLRRFSKRKGI